MSVLSAVCRVEVPIAFGVEEQFGAAKKIMEGLHAAINPAEHLGGNKKENCQKSQRLPRRWTIGKCEQSNKWSTPATIDRPTGRVEP